MSINKTLGLAITAVLLQGCTIPGSTVYLEQKTNSKGNFNYTDNTGAKQVAGLNTYIITPELVADLTIEASTIILNPTLDTAICSGKINPNTVLSGNITLNNEVFNEKTKTVIQSGI